MPLAIRTGTGTVYTFNYGNFALRRSINIGSRTLATYDYESRTNRLISLDNGNGDGVKYTYDSLGRVIEEEFEDGDTVTYAYDNDGALATVTDSATGRKTTYYYDFTDRLMKYTESGSDFSHSVGYEYDSLNNLTAQVEVINGDSRSTSYRYDDDNRVTRITNGSTVRAYTYDAYGRVGQHKISYNGTDLVTQTYGYRTVGGGATGQVETMTYSGGLNRTYTYTYDANGNITSISDGTHTTRYTYDQQNQLLREDNQAGGFTHVWTYDAGGNITSRTEYDYTTGTLGTESDTIPYSYYGGTWRDLLEYYDGKYMTTDIIGNLIKDAKGWNYTWEHGRELAAVSGTIQYPSPSVMPLAETGEKNGLYTDDDGEIRYYVNGVATYAGLIYVDGYYYYINSSLTAVRNCTYWVSKSNDLLPSTNYDFDAQGRMIDAPDARIDVDISYTYNADGLRTNKAVTSSYELSNSETVRQYNYVYNGSQLTGLTVTVTGDGVTVATHNMRIAYDANGPMFIKYNDLTYQYVTNLQGDVIALLDHNGNVVVEYTYDAWGNILTLTGALATTLGEYTPLRYRGYVYDTETNLYYLQSRYYNPEVGRFINADAFVSTGQGLLGDNMFAYCLNNPVFHYDSTGNRCCTIFLSDDPFVGIFYGSGEGGGGGSCTYASSFGLQYSSNAHGSINLAESSARQYGGTATSQVLPFEYDLFSMNNKGLVLFNADVSLFKTTYDWGNMSCTPIDWFGIETSAGLTTDKGLHLGAMAYIMSGSLSFSIGTLNFTFDGYLGGIGAEAAVRPGFVTVGWAKGVGWGFTVEWDT